MFEGDKQVTLTEKSTLADVYRKTAAIYRESAREWRELANRAPDGLAFIMLGNAERNDQLAAADMARASDLCKTSV